MRAKERIAYWMEGLECESTEVVWLKKRVGQLGSWHRKKSLENDCERDERAETSDVPCPSSACLLAVRRERLVRRRRRGCRSCA